MIISSALPIKFWLNEEEVYNSKDEPGVDHRVWRQPLQPDDRIILQVTDDFPLDLKLLIKDVDGNTVETIDFTLEELEDSYMLYVDFTLSEYNITDEIVSFVIASLQTELTGTITGLIGEVDGTIVGYGVIFEIEGTIEAPLGEVDAAIVNQTYPEVHIQNYATDDINIDDVDILGYTLTPHHGTFPLDSGDQLDGNSSIVGTLSYRISIDVVTINDPHYLSIQGSDGVVQYRNLSGSFDYVILNVVTNNINTVLIEVRPGSITE